MAKSKKRKVGEKMTEENKVEVAILEPVTDADSEMGVNDETMDTEISSGMDSVDSTDITGDTLPNTDNELVPDSGGDVSDLEVPETTLEEPKDEVNITETVQATEVLPVAGIYRGTAAKVITAIQEGRVEAYVDKVIPATAEELEAEIVPNNDICSWDKGIDGQLKDALNTLNEVSSRDTKSILNARHMIYNNLFNAITYAKTDELAYEFIRKFLDVLATKPHVIAKDRALIGFLQMDKLSRPQANMYQIIWSALVNTATPSTRKVNSQSINWKMMSSMTDYHKRGGILYNRLYGFYQRC